MRRPHWSVGLLVAAAVLTCVHLVGAAVTSPLLPSAPVLVWAALLAYAVVAGWSAPGPVRSAMVAVPVAMGVPAVVDHTRRLLAEAGGYGWTGYSGTSGLASGWTSRWWELVPALGGCLALGVLVWRLPVPAGRSPTPGDRVVAAVCGAGFVAYLAYDLRHRWVAEDRWTPAGFVGTAAPVVLLAVVLLVLGLVLVVRCRARVVGVGAALLAVALAAAPWPVQWITDSWSGAGSGPRTGAYPGGGVGAPELVLPVHGPALVPLPEHTSLAVLPALVLAAQVVAVAVLLVGLGRGAGSRTRAHGAVRRRS
ncbi:hypothetical protein [Micromonospora sp. SH-82]|uniref:hypothetical protein n=1 Tax=Micromonospora sp. SH-82 TaxID=3132938 RepID=UPI003EB6A130